MWLLNNINNGSTDDNEGDVDSDSDDEDASGFYRANL